MVRTKPYAEKKTFAYNGVELRTYTKSEARALFKKKLGVGRKGRLPAGAVIETVFSLQENLRIDQ